MLKSPNLHICILLCQKTTKEKYSRKINEADFDGCSYGTIISKLGQKYGMKLGKQRGLTVIGVVKRQSLILDGDHLESVPREAACEIGRGD
jgi:hypothetical protein